MTVSLALWDWPSAIALLAVGFLVGYTIWPNLWPIRIAEHRMPPVLVTAIAAVGTIFVFFAFLFALRWMTGDPFPLVTALQEELFVAAAAVGLRTRAKAVEA